MPASLSKKTHRSVGLRKWPAPSGLKTGLCAALNNLLLSGATDEVAARRQVTNRRLNGTKAEPPVPLNINEIARFAAKYKAPAARGRNETARYSLAGAELPVARV